MHAVKHAQDQTSLSMLLTESMPVERGVSPDGIRTADQRRKADQDVQLQGWVQAIADQLQGGDMALDYDQILAKRPASEDAIFAW